ncbi:MAG: hypothetical protein AABY15_00945 [Nanoarchaeota archaeon]
MNKRFFKKHQKVLLWFLNAPLIKYWFRWILCINGKQSSLKNRDVAKIIPNAIFWREEENYAAEFRTHNKFSKRLYYGFYPVWCIMHGWDFLIGDRIFYPALSFGFETLTVFPDADPETTSVDGLVAQDEGVGGNTWANIRGAAGNYNDATFSPLQFISIKAAGSTNNWREIDRFIALFDTSSLPNITTIASAKCSVWPTTINDNHDMSFDIVASTPASNTALVNGDYAQLGTTLFGSIDITSMVTGQYNDITVNSSGLTAISKTSVTKYGFRASKDRTNTEPTWVADLNGQVLCHQADQTGTSNDPKLVVTYGGGVPNLLLMGVG